MTPAICVCVRPMTSHGQSTHTHTCGDRWGFYILFLSLLHPLDGLPCTMARHRRRPSTDFCGWYVWWGEENYDKVTTTTTTTTTTTAVCVCVCLAQIAGTRAEPQQIVAQRLLSCLQYPVPFKSSTKDLTWPTYEIVFLPIKVLYDVDPKVIVIHEHRSRWISSVPAWILT